MLKFLDIRIISKHLNDYDSCYNHKTFFSGQCRSTCRSEERKPGTCPAGDDPRWMASCVETCNQDSQCDGTQRCCKHGCSSMCSEPVDLMTVSGKL